ncbi:MAG: hypothetical protein HY671_10235, partial [Chloroflexi bacterium]|nr:hypothetical protein [Chloroflexota bacterium]
RNGPFVGAGPGAHSFLRGARFSILPGPREYIAAVKQLESRKTGPPALPPEGPRLSGPEPLQAIAPVDGFDPISEELERRETLILGLRLNEGVSLEGYAARYGASPLDLYRPALEQSIADGLLALEACPERSERGGVLRLTPRGRLLANEVFVRVLG